MEQRIIHGDHRSLGAGSRSVLRYVIYWLLLPLCESVSFSLFFGACHLTTPAKPCRTSIPMPSCGEHSSPLWVVSRFEPSLQAPGLGLPTSSASCAPKPGPFHFGPLPSGRHRCGCGDIDTHNRSNPSTMHPAALNAHTADEYGR